MSNFRRGKFLVNLVQHEQQVLDDNAIEPDDSRCSSPLTTEQFTIAKSMEVLLGALAPDDDDDDENNLQFSENVHEIIGNPYVAPQITLQEEILRQSPNKLVEQDVPTIQYDKNTNCDFFPLSNAQSIEQDIDTSYFDSPSNLPFFTHSTPISVLNNIIENDFEEPINNETGETGKDFNSDDSVADPNYILPEATGPSFTPNQSMLSDDEPTSPSVLNENNNSPVVVYQIVTETDEEDQLIEQSRQETEIPPPTDVVEVPLIAQTKRRNKRKKPETWEKNIKKKLRNTGQEYITYKGKIAGKKTVKSIGSKCCNLHCENAIDDEGKIKIFTAFWNLGDLSKQRHFISKNVTRTKTESSRVENSRRKHTQIYTLMHNSKRITVCKKFFINTLNISEKMIRTALDKAERGICEIQSPDKRGRHVPSNKDPSKTAFAIKHIELFPAVPSHWCRKDTKKLYLESNLNREKMYELYKIHCEQNGQTAICKTSYKELLIAKNVEFYKPRKDQCWCYRFEGLPIEEKILRQEEYNLHIRRKDEAREAKRNDTNIAKHNNEVMCVNFDLEAVLYSPLFYAKPLFYKRKLASFNFTVYDPIKKQGYCYIWPEYEGNRGANEVATCLRDFIKSIGPEVKHLILYSDCCPGQNRNSILATMLSATIAEVDIEIIDYKFLESGHTYMECDSMHATIERASETAKIYIPQDWYNVIKLAKKQNPYKLKEMDHSHFTDFKKQRGSIVSTLKATDGTVLQWSKVKWIRFEKNAQNVLYFKYEYKDDEFKKVYLLPKRTNTRSAPRNSDGSTRAYSGKLPISSAKYKDLMDLCSTNIIPTCYHDFYRNIPNKSFSNPEQQQPMDGVQDEDDLSLAAFRTTYAKRRPQRKN